MYSDNGFPGGGFSNTMFSVFPVLFICAFVVILIIFIVMAIKGVGQWSKNNGQPVLIVTARLVSKRTDVSSSMHTGSDSINHSHTSTSYYLTFEVETGSRMEFYVNGNEYGILVEGDTGKLKFQGTRYLGFERDGTSRTTVV